MKFSSAFRPRSPLRISYLATFNLVLYCDLVYSTFDFVPHCDLVLSTFDFDLVLNCDSVYSTSSLSLITFAIIHLVPTPINPVTLRFTQKHFSTSSRILYSTQYHHPSTFTVSYQVLEGSFVLWLPESHNTPLSSCPSLQSHLDRTWPQFIILFSALHLSDICKRIILEPTARVFKHHSQPSTK